MLVRVTDCLSLHGLDFEITPDREGARTRAPLPSKKGSVNGSVNGQSMVNQHFVTESRFVVTPLRNLQR
jgi:hypothetical protein